MIGLYEGIVTEVKDKEFAAELNDLIYSQDGIIEASFLVDKINKEQRHLLKLGAVFYVGITENGCSIGFRMKHSFTLEEI